MIVGLDTTVLVRLLSGVPENLALMAIQFVIERQQAGDRLRVSELVVAEAYYALQHHYGASKREALATLKGFLASTEIDGSGDIAEVLATPRLESVKPGFVDRIIHHQYIRSGADQLVTFEKAAGKLDKVLVLSAG